MGRPDHDVPCRQQLPIAPRCDGARCEAPVACGGFGYCRLRNFPTMPAPALQLAWRAEQEQPR